jgi:hypothetical protein
VYSTLLFSLLLEAAAQKMVMENSSMRSSRVCAALIAVHMELWSLLLLRFTRETT